uniref:Uncharacterized protein n=1 Tax=Amphimedon queenslandica TaxID=400682 RepID=A0A1X7U0T4_AMPQE
MAWLKDFDTAAAVPATFLSLFLLFPGLPRSPLALPGLPPLLSRNPRPAPLPRDPSPLPVPLPPPLPAPLPGAGGPTGRKDHNLLGNSSGRLPFCLGGGVEDGGLMGEGGSGLLPPPLRCGGKSSAVSSGGGSKF